MDQPRLLAEAFSHGCVIGCLNVGIFALCSNVGATRTGRIHTDTSDSSVTTILSCLNARCTRPGRTGFKRTRNGGIICVRLRDVRRFLVSLSLASRANVATRIAPFLGDLCRDDSSCDCDGVFRRANRKGADSTRLVLSGSLFKLPRNSTFARVNTSGAFRSTPTVLNRAFNCASTIFRKGINSF